MTDLHHIVVEELWHVTNGQYTPLEIEQAADRLLARLAEAQKPVAWYVFARTSKQWAVDWAVSDGDRDAHIDPIPLVLPINHRSKP